MTIAISLFTGPIYIDLPQGLTGWLGWFALLASGAVFVWRWRTLHRKWNRRNWIIFTILAVLTPILAAFLVVRLPAGDALPPPGKPVDPTGPALVVLAAVPLLFAGGLLGVWPAAFFGAVTGLVIALGDTHSPFTPLEYAYFGLVFGLFFQQRYRTRFYRMLHHPLPAAVLVASFYPLLFTLNTLLQSGGALAGRLDYALTRAGYASIAVAAELLVAGMFGQVVALLLPHAWGNTAPLIPSPAEKKLETRFLYSMAPLALVLIVVLIWSDWVVAGNAAREMLRDRMSSAAQTASDTVPFFMEAGQNLIQQLASDPRLVSTSTKDLDDVLAQDLRSVPFFRQLFLLDSRGRPVAGYPLESYTGSHPPADELVGVELALHGVPIQHYTIPPQEGESAAQISFMATVFDEDGEARRVLIGRADLASNLFIQPVIADIRNMVGSDGEGMLVDETGRILYHTNSFRLQETFSGDLGGEARFYDASAPDGTRQLVYYQPGTGHAWSVVLTVPAHRTQQMALNIAAPLLGIVILLFLLAGLVIRLSLRVVTASLHSLSIEARRIAGGQLDHQLVVDGEDEVGQLRRAFEQMRVSLKARLEELNRLLLVSQGVASSLEMDEAVKPLLEAALASGVSSVRIVLAPGVFPSSESDSASPSRFGRGSASDLYAYLDPQIMALTRQQDRIILNNLGRVRSITIPGGSPRPEALLALALRHESQYYGALWLAYDQPHQYTEDEIRFLVTLAGQAAVAAANTSLFQSAEIGRQRLASILASTPDPVLVTDQQSRLLLSNPAAWQVLGFSPEYSEGKPIEQITSHHHELVRLLRNSASGKESAEIVLTDGRVYLATASSVLADGKRVGRVCLLRDITHFKELDSMKSEFVATVSHDLRSPLTLMRGYATMLEMVGELNEQQAGYVRKVVTAVESMSRLVSNLLDLGRIEAGIDLQLETILLHDVVERVVSTLQLQANQKRITLMVDIPNNTTPLIQADQALLQQALHNLIENAIKYTESGGKVRVRVSGREDGLVFEVSDTGMGVAPVDLPRLFEKFFRGVQRDSKKQPGTGLGLAIVKSIAERHGGRVWVESQLGKGSTFFMLVPIRQDGSGRGTAPAPQGA